MNIPTRRPIRARLAGGFAWLLGALAIITTLSLSACGGGGSSSLATPTSSSSTGTVLVGLTDADGDFLNYVVGVKALDLTRADGAVVHALPPGSAEVQVDFAQYTDLTEFLTAASVPKGRYTQVTMTLDYANADIEVAQGPNSVKVTPVDSNGSPITGTLDVNVTLDSKHPLVVAPGLPANMTLDFDLQATNTVDLSNNTVTVQPMLLADLDMTAPKPHRVRGPLLSVDTTNDSFQLSIRPFHLKVGDFGKLTVTTDNNTVFEIDGKSYQGTQGLAALAVKTAGTAVVAKGQIQLPGRSFMATEVRAGSSVAFGSTDVVRGSVVAVSGNTLTVKGASLTRTDGSLTLNDSVSVTVDPSTTKVTKELSPGTHTSAEISVGQRITALGTLSGCPSACSLDATQGLVRMEQSTVTGTASSPASGNVLAVSLQSINGRPSSLYDFTGTNTCGNAVHPAVNTCTYNINVSGLNVASVGSSGTTPVRVLGFPQPFGAAGTGNPAADFDANTVIDLSSVPAWLAVGWNPPTDTAFNNISTQSLVLNVPTSSTHALVQLGVATNLTAAATLAPDTTASGPQLYVVVEGKVIHIFTTFGDFATELANQSSAMKTDGVLARGTWDNGTNTLTGRFIAAKLQ